MVQLITPREVPLGGPRAMGVRRTLPHRDRSLIGAWCFADHYGPDHVAATGGMHVPVHPHTGLQTVSWLFEGEIEHRDSAGNHAMVLPGEVNLMTAGSGICHSERSTPSTEVLHGVQLWVALPDAARFVERGFEHHAPPLLTGPGWSARVFLGSLLGQTSPVSTYTSLLGAELTLAPDATLTLEVDPTYELGVLVDTGSVGFDATTLKAAELGFRAPGESRLDLVAGAEGARVILLGGQPFEEPIVMWWNFVGRTHEEIVEFRDRWQAEIAAEPRVAGPVFGLPDEDPEPPLPAPALPHTRLRARAPRETT